MSGAEDQLNVLCEQLGIEIHQILDDSSTSDSAQYEVILPITSEEPLSSASMTLAPPVDHEVETFTGTSCQSDVYSSQRMSPDEMELIRVAAGVENDRTEYTIPVDETTRTRRKVTLKTNRLAGPKSKQSSAKELPLVMYKDQEDVVYDFDNNLSDSLNDSMQEQLDSITIAETSGFVIENPLNELGMSEIVVSCDSTHVGDHIVNNRKRKVPSTSKVDDMEDGSSDRRKQKMPKKLTCKSGTQLSKPGRKNYKSLKPPVKVSVMKTKIAKKSKTKDKDWKPTSVTKNKPRTNSRNLESYKCVDSSNDQGGVESPDSSLIMSGRRRRCPKIFEDYITEDIANAMKVVKKAEASEKACHRSSSLDNHGDGRSVHTAQQETTTDIELDDKEKKKANFQLKEEDKNSATGRHKPTRIKMFTRPEQKLGSGKKGRPISKIYKCQQCSYTTKHMSHMTVHQSIHLPAKPFQCAQCDFKSRYALSLKKHALSSHSNDSPFVCLVCNYKTINNKCLKSHMKKHETARPFRCKHCPFTTKRRTSLLTHEKTHSPKRPFACGQCSFTTKFKNSLVLHVRALHSDDKPYRCEFCDFGATCKSNLIQHRRTHTGVKLFTCEECGDGFTTNNSLKSHMFIHMGLHPYECIVCFKSFRQQAHLVRHSILHTKDRKRFPCVVCDQVFSLKENLKRHMLVHSDGVEKLFACSLCNRKFHHKSNLERHARTVHLKVREFECFMCNKTFSTKFSVVSHLKKVHAAKDSVAQDDRIAKTKKKKMEKKKTKKKSRVLYSSDEDEMMGVEVDVCAERGIYWKPKRRKRIIEANESYVPISEVTCPANIECRYDYANNMFQISRQLPVVLMPRCDDLDEIEPEPSSYKMENIFVYESCSGGLVDMISTSDVDEPDEEKDSFRDINHKLVRFRNVLANDGNGRLNSTGMDNTTESRYVANSSGKPIGIVWSEEKSMCTPERVLKPVPIQIIYNPEVVDKRHVQNDPNNIVQDKMETSSPIKHGASVSASSPCDEHNYTKKATHVHTPLASRSNLFDVFAKEQAAAENNCDISNSNMNRLAGKSVVEQCSRLLNCVPDTASVTNTECFEKPENPSQQTAPTEEMSPSDMSKAISVSLLHDTSGHVVLVEEGAVEKAPFVNGDSTLDEEGNGDIQNGIATIPSENGHKDVSEETGTDDISSFCGNAKVGEYVQENQIESAEFVKDNSGCNISCNDETIENEVGTSDICNVTDGIAVEKVQLVENSESS